mmetsp:Transcript_2585/g.7445  ORF Transcript_2585/g.7445 Transcript_2585/m.7445 type:complete len:248 (-) Transcript_2585:98-841(-)
MMRLAVAAIFVTVAAGAPPVDSAAAHAEALRGDDECLVAGAGAEECALNAMQRRGFLTREAEALAGAPDFARTQDDGDDMDDEASAEFEDPDDEYLPDDQPKAASLSQQMARANGTWVEGVDKVAVTNCHVEGGNTCPHGETCVVKHDKTWSQCVNCHKVEFGRECQKMNDVMRWAAIHTCKRSCLDTQCYNKQWCLKPYRCVLDSKREWGQCISCHSKKFWHHSCHSMKADLLEQAEQICHKKCKV